MVSALHIYNQPKILCRNEPIYTQHNAKSSPETLHNGGMHARELHECNVSAKGVSSLFSPRPSKIFPRHPKRSLELVG